MHKPLQSTLKRRLSQDQTRADNCHGLLKTDKTKLFAAPKQFITAVKSNEENSVDKIQKEKGRFIQFT